MALETFGIQKGFKIYGNTGGASKLFYENFSGANPGNGFGANDDLAVDSSTGHFYKKTAGVWAKYGISADIANAGAGFRLVEGFQYITAVDISAFSGLTQTATLDNGSSVTFTAGDKVASTFDGVVYAAAAGAWTVFGTQPSNNDAFFVTTALMDGNLSQGSTFYKFTTGPATFTRLADFDFEVATTIGFSGYSKPASNALTAVNGASDTVQGAIEKLDTGEDNLRTALGITVLTDTGVLVTGIEGISTASVRTILQNIIDDVATEVSELNVTTAVDIDTPLLSNGKKVEWMLDITEAATPGNKYSTKVSAVSDGTNVSYSFSNITEMGTPITGLTVTVTGTAGDMTLTVASTNAVNVKSRRYQV